MSTDCCFSFFFNSMANNESSYQDYFGFCKTLFLVLIACIN